MISEKEWICTTCYEAATQGRKARLDADPLGPLSVPELPQELRGLKRVECLLISPRILFESIQQKPSGGQYALKGNIINVPADMSKSIAQLPRSIDACGLLHVEFKRRLCYTRSYEKDTIRPKVVLEAAHYLLHNSELFKREGLEILEDWDLLDNPEFDSELYTICSDDNMSKKVTPLKLKRLENGNFGIQKGTESGT